VGLLSSNFVDEDPLGGGEEKARAWESGGRGKKKRKEPWGVGMVGSGSPSVKEEEWAECQERQLLGGGGKKAKSEGKSLKEETWEGEFGEIQKG